MYLNEMLKICLAIFATRIFPKKIRTRLSRFLYNYNSPNISGINLIVPYSPLRMRDGKKINILINTKEFIGWNIFFLGAYEKSTNIVLQKTIKEGFCVIEAGAHIGSETLLIADIVGGGGNVYAFEPNPVIQMQLRINIQINNFEKIVRLPSVALGEKNAMIDFYLNDDFAPNQGMSSKYKYNESHKQIKVEQISLDNWVLANEIPKVDYIKMDVQGAEIDILHGAKNTIEKYRPIIFTEAEMSSLNDSNNSLKELFVLLESFKYSIHLILENGDYKLLTLDLLKEGNWIAFPKD